MAYLLVFLCVYHVNLVETAFTLPDSLKKFASEKGLFASQPAMKRRGTKDESLWNGIAADGSYGVDITTPVHHYIDENVAPYFKERYDRMIEGCYRIASRPECIATEKTRLEMNRDQPKTQHNYTKVGFKLTRTPPEVWEPLQAFYEKHKHEAKLERWPRGYTYVNTWDSPSDMINLESFPHGDKLKKIVWDGVQTVVEPWIGNRKVQPSSQYGIRVYKNRSILATHVDRLPLVSSAIINVDQDLDEPWPIEVYDHDGKAHNVTMKPGDMVLYESHTILHGRPFPMNGRFYANLFVHFIPIDHDLNNDMDAARFNTMTIIKGHSGHEASNHDNQALQRNRVIAQKESLSLFDQELYDSMRDNPADQVRYAAQVGAMDELEKLLKSQHDTHLINSKDRNEWTALHEAARSGNDEIVRYLVLMGSDLSNKNIDGETALDVARGNLPKDHAVIRYLLEIGAP